MGVVLATRQDGVTVHTVSGSAIQGQLEGGPGQRGRVVIDNKLKVCYYLALLVMLSIMSWVEVPDSLFRIFISTSDTSLSRERSSSSMNIPAPLSG